MSLDWELSEIKNKDEVCWVVDVDGNKRMSFTTETLLLLSPVVGLGRLQENNWHKWYKRLYMLEVVNGPSRAGVDKNGNRVEVRIAPEEVRAHIGLKTNVIDESDSRFAKRLQQMLRDKATQALREWELASRPKEEKVCG